MKLGLAVGLSVVLVAGCGSGSRTSAPPTVYTTPPTVTQTVENRASSMEPTVHCARPSIGCEAPVADAVVVQSVRPNDLKRGDIVLFNTPPLAATMCGASGRFLKRVIGLPGDVWAERNGYVYIDGKKLNEPYVKPGRRDSQTLTLSDVPPKGTMTKIPADTYLMMGDNRSSSCDSRVWGLVPGANIIGRVQRIIRSR
jgi:signal peptidase I